MATILIPHCVQVNLKGQDDEGSELLHVFDVRAPSALPTPTELLGITVAVQNWITNYFKSHVVLDNTRIQEIVATSRAELNGPQQTSSVDALGQRHTDGTMLPSGSTIAIKKNTGLSGRSHRGRFYAWPFQQSDLDTGNPNLISSTFATLLLDNYSPLITILADAGSPLVVASNVHAALTDVVTVSLSDLAVDSQRRRLAGRGR